MEPILTNTRTRAKARIRIGDTHFPESLSVESAGVPKLAMVLRTEIAFLGWQEITIPEFYLFSRTCAA
jgi:hypothetical protein